MSGTRPFSAPRIWDTASGALKVCLSGHTGPVWSAAFSPDGYYVVTASQDQTARIWDATKGRVLLLLQGHRTSISSAAFAPDSRSVLTTSDDGTAILHTIDPGAMYRFGCRLLQALRKHPDAPAEELRPLLVSCAT